MSQPPLFFVALVPEDPIQEEVTAFKQYAANNFNSSHALKAPAHITLKSPFRWPLKKMGALKETLNSIGSRHEPFTVVLEDFDVFEPRVIFVDVTPTPSLMALQEDVEETLRALDGWQDDRKIRPFHPHMTVAFKDLKRSRFKPAWTHFNKIEYKRSFEAKTMVLLNHREGRWHEHSIFQLG